MAIAGTNTSPARCGGRWWAMGFTLVEVVLVLAIVATLTSIAIPQTRRAITLARIARASGDIRAIEADLATYDAEGKLPASLADIGVGLLDPWGNPYQYLRFDKSKGKGPPAGARKDRFMVPINSTYDLYSMGEDGKTTAPLTSKAGSDDIIRGSDGSYVGLASNY
jgi:general secretion pathway protein G